MIHVSPEQSQQSHSRESSWFSADGKKNQKDAALKEQFNVQMDVSLMSVLQSRNRMWLA